MEMYKPKITKFSIDNANRIYIGCRQIFLILRDGTINETKKDDKILTVAQCRRYTCP